MVTIALDMLKIGLFRSDIDRRVDTATKDCFGVWIYTRYVIPSNLHMAAHGPAV